jgi:hypothetical protein
VRLAYVAALLALYHAPSAETFAFFIGSQRPAIKVVERECVDPIHRGKGPLRLQANPLHRKAKRAVHAFS